MTLFKCEHATRQTGHWIVRWHCFLTHWIRPPFVHDIATIQFNVDHSIVTRDERTLGTGFSVHGELTRFSLLIQTEITLGSDGTKFHAMLGRFADDKLTSLNTAQWFPQECIRQAFLAVGVSITGNNEFTILFSTSTRTHGSFVIARVDLRQGILAGFCRLQGSSNAFVQINKFRWSSRHHWMPGDQENGEEQWGVHCNGFVGTVSWGLVHEMPGRGMRESLI